MNRYDIIEFSKLYKRLLAVEITLKNRLMYALTATYPNKAFNRLLPYLINTIPHSKYMSGNGRVKRDRINDLISSNKSQEEKLLKFFNMAYLYDVLALLTNYKQLMKDKAFKVNFYKNIPQHTLIEKHASNLNNLRNAIMHFNFNKYSQNKTDYLESLGFWERLIFCPNHFMHSLPAIKPDTAKILKLLATACPDFYELDDRVICDMFDDLAFINGKPINKLPKLWTIGRQIYLLKQLKNRNLSE